MIDQFGFEAPFWELFYLKILKEDSSTYLTSLGGFFNFISEDSLKIITKLGKTIFQGIGQI